ncbi:prepilin-type N-terminal cleavage/methylation domain-containing protein [Cerasicoccus maritimus]|uniref:prepilin-type N-terminal cleavage/methylation domain-containing protein n=1 Tax=Cerasicoccus maritimus TaxID=490089 RepID=UPI00285277DD|nr:prepilin-type N-terminal cleavage/methylation domain-containing protein [Cerasicoccus maritimus]
MAHVVAGAREIKVELGINDIYVSKSVAQCSDRLDESVQIFCFPILIDLYGFVDNVTLPLCCHWFSLWDILPIILFTLMRRPPPAAFTLVELLTVIAIVGVLSAILIPVVGNIREKANQAGCTSNLRQLHMTAMAITADNDGILPAAQINHSDSGSDNSKWVNTVLDYVDYPSLNDFKRSFSCLSYEGNNSGTFWMLGYAYNESPAYQGDSSGLPNSKLKRSNYRVNDYDDKERIYYRLSEVTFPERRIMFVDSDAWHINRGFSESIHPDIERHGSFANAVFFDGHVEQMFSLDDIKLSVSDPQKYTPKKKTGEG